MTTFPVQALLGQLHWSTALAALGLALGLFLGVSAFWRYALRHYTGASS